MADIGVRDHVMHGPLLSPYLAGAVLVLDECLHLLYEVQAQLPKQCSLRELNRGAGR